MESELSNAPSIESIKSAEYDRKVSIYKSLVTGGRIDKRGVLDQQTELRFASISTEDATKAITLADSIVSLLPEQVFTDKTIYPTSRESVKAMVATTFAFNGEGKKDDYIKLLAALSNDNYAFDNGRGWTTNEVIENFFETDFSRDSLFNCIVGLSICCTPISGYQEEKLTENRTKYDNFVRVVQQKRQEVMETFGKECDQLIPEVGRKYLQEDIPIVFVNQISGLRIYSNDRVRSGVENYSNLKAGAIAYGVEKVTGLPLVVNELPWNYTEATDNPNSVPTENPADRLAATYVHEQTHVAFGKEVETQNDWEELIVEMLTDSTAAITFLRTYHQPFVATPDAFHIKDGYASLVNVARSLVENNFVTEDELVSYGLRQDASHFLDLLQDRLLESPNYQGTKDVYLELMRMGLVRPQKEDGRRAKIIDFRENPIGFMQVEMMEMWKLTDTQFLGQKWYLIDMFNSLKEKHPSIAEKDFRAIWDKKDGVLIDECVDMFNVIFSREKKRLFHRPTWLKNDSLEKLYQEHKEDLTSLEDDLPSADKWEIVRAVNGIMSDNVAYELREWPDNLKFTSLIKSTEDIYNGTKNILKNRWGSQGIPVTDRTIARVLLEIVPSWFNNLPVRQTVSNPDLTVKRVLSTIEMVLAPVDKENGAQGIITPDQFFYWGPAVELNLE